VKKFGSLSGHIEAAVSAYAEEVRAGTFPGPEHVYLPKKP
jgi:3-methyl-2-oxobutanoate hydroxymethyltransferase